MSSDETIRVTRSSGSLLDWLSVIPPVPLSDPRYLLSLSSVKLEQWKGAEASHFRHAVLDAYKVVDLDQINHTSAKDSGEPEVFITPQHEYVLAWPPSSEIDDGEHHPRHLDLQQWGFTCALEIHHLLLRPPLAPSIEGTSHLRVDLEFWSRVRVYRVRVVGPVAWKDWQIRCERMIVERQVTPEELMLGIAGSRIYPHGTERRNESGCLLAPTDHFIRRDEITRDAVESEENTTKETSFFGKLLRGCCCCK